jgi:UDP-arabinose 4-epimerase
MGRGRVAYPRKLPADDRMATGGSLSSPGTARGERGSRRRPRSPAPVRPELAMVLAVSILIVGGAGYIGSQTAKRVAAAGHTPVVFDNLEYGHEWAVKWGPFVKGDLADASLVERVLRDHAVTSVIDFAAYAYVGESVTAPRKYFRNNVVCTLNLLDAMVDVGVDKIVFSSTCATYGEPLEVPITENHPQHPVNPYGETKLAVEKILHWYGGAYGIRSVALRYFNAAGADPDGALGEEHDPETHLIPLAIAAALDDKRELSIFGTDYPTPDGTAIRDYVHVADLADAHWLALSHLSGKGESLRLNLGTGRGHSVREVIAAVEKVSGRRVRTREVGRRAGDPPALVADARLAATALGWRPGYPALETVVEHAFRWHERHPR